MLPLTPPHETSESFDASAEAIDRENRDGVPLTASSQYPVQPQISVATPISNCDMGFDRMAERSEMERSDFQDLSDEDQDMSDGGAELSNGAPLTMTLSHGQALSAEMDMMDAEMTDHGDLDVLFHNHHSPSTPQDDVPYYYSEPFHGEHFTPSFEDDSHDMIDDGLALGEENTPGFQSAFIGLPEVMSELSQQLQHIQDGQEHADFTSVLDAQNGALDNSISPLPFLSLSFISAGNSADVLSVNVSPGHPQTGQLSTSPGFVPQPWGPGGLMPPDAEDGLVLSQTYHIFHSEIDIPVSYFLTSDANADDDLVASETDQIEVEDQFNLSLGDFLQAWGRTLSRDEEPRRRARGPILPAVSRQRELRNLKPMKPCDLQGERCDIQRIDWMELGIGRLEARDMRRQTYKNYTNLRASHRADQNGNVPILSNHNGFFKFRRMDFDHEIHLSHFQLRNLVACASRDHIFYAGRSQVMHYSPMEGSGLSDRYSVAMDLTQPAVQSFHGLPGAGVQISTLTVAHNVLVAGGFCGEYGITNLRAHKDSKHAEGIITDDSNAITNHVQVHLSRGSSLPLAAFASNDKGVRILDVNTNQFIADHRYEHAINCTAISPDQRLRVLTGDTRKVMICNSETGEILQELDGHRDYGFACDWADDGWTVATGNQDMQVKIWDARKWKNSQGMASPIATIAADMAGVRKLKFSPVGSGKRVLIAAEPADLISVIDAETFSNKQTLSFFGEIGGVDFTNNGNDLIIANCDSMRGGLMEFERCGLAGNAFYEVDDLGGWEAGRNGRQKASRGYDWIANDEDLVQHSKSRRTKTHRTRKPAILTMAMAGF